MKFRLFATNGLLLIILLTCLIIALVPLNPVMPYEGLDGSWMHAINVAMNNKLQFGKDIIFTFGPYGSIYTNIYHPYTDKFMLFGSLYLALCFYIILKELFFDNRKVTLLLFCLFIIFFRFYRDELLYCYSILFILYTVRLKDNGINEMTKWSYFNQALIYSAVSMFLLIKGTFVIFPIILFISLIYLLYNKLYLYFFIGLSSFLLSTIFLWIIANQELNNIFYYFINMLPIIEGYSNAMGLNSFAFQIMMPFYFFFVLFVLLKIVVSKKIERSTIVYVIITLSIFFFFYFKYAFTRQSARPFNFASFFVFGTLFLSSYLKKKTSLMFFILSILFMTILTMRYSNNINKYNLFYSLGLQLPQIPNGDKITKSKGLFSSIKYSNLTLINSISDNFYFNFNSILTGLKLRINNNLKELYNAKIFQIRSKKKIKLLPGTVDIYTVNTIDLLSTNMLWKPRPIFQSYSSYTEKLINFNENSLEGPYAPDFLLVNLETIDNRFPLLDDGSSYLKMLSNYNFYDVDSNYIYLKKNLSPIKLSMRKILSKKVEYNQKQIIPKSNNGLIFAKIKIKENTLSMIYNKIYKLPLLYIYVYTNTLVKKYRIIPNMAENGFILSPLVETRQDIQNVFLKNILNESDVKSILVNWEYGNKIFFNNEFEIELYKINFEK
jgi:hypothetical protein